MDWIDWLISGILAFIMLSVGLSLNSRGFIITFARPRAYITGLFLRLLFLPALAFGVAFLTPLPLAFKVGFVILSACPGGTTSNFITYLVNANVALSIALTVTCSLIALLSVPFIANFTLGFFMNDHVNLQLSVGETILQIFTITIIPVVIGILIRRSRPDWARNIERTLKWITVVLLGVVFLVKFFAGEDQGGTGITWAEIGSLLPPALFINLVGLLSGLVAGRQLGLPVADQQTLGIEVGVQNTSLAFLITSTLIGNEDMLKPALVYAMFSFFTSVAYGWLLRQNALKMRT